jgi:glycine C-acetyltransferase
MALDRLDQALKQDLLTLHAEGRAKAPERVIVHYIPPEGPRGPRYGLQGVDGEFLRMNSNSYLSLSNHPRVIEAAHKATDELGAGPGAVRFIDGTFVQHVRLEERIARFMDKPAAKIFNSAYTTVCGVALAITNKRTYWIGDELNHNCIIRAMRIANVPRENKAIYPHNDMEALQQAVQNVPNGIERVIVVFDGIFSMRGDFAPVERVVDIAEKHNHRFNDGVITVMDDSHGIGAYGETGRGTAEFTGASPDVIIGTFGKAFGVNGGFAAAGPNVIEALRQKADTYIYTNPLSVGDCAAALEALDIADGPEGKERLSRLKARTEQFRRGLFALGLESIPGPHPVVPLMVRDTDVTNRLVERLFKGGVLAVGLTFPVVPRGDETIRFQVNADHTEQDIQQVLGLLSP